MLDKRTKPVNIRVSEDDFQKLREACEKMGTRNVSELARAALRLIVDEHRSPIASGKDAMVCLDDLTARLTYLQEEVGRLKALLNPNI